MEARNVLLVTIDSLRADHVGCLGYQDRTTPRLDDFAEEAITFSNAQAHGPTTFVSFPSIHTGVQALAHPDYPKLNEPTIAYALREAGYHTKAIVASNGWLSPVYGYDSGFAEFDNLGIGPNMATTWRQRIIHLIGDMLDEEGVLYRTLKAGRDWMRSVDERTAEETIHQRAIDHVARDGPTFTWVHYMTTHHPYTPDPERQEEERDEKELVAFQRSVIERSRDPEADVPIEDRDRFESLYDASIRHVDRRVGDLLAEVRDDCAVIVTADHGEAFWEHGYCEHTPELHQELLHVPLWVSYLGCEPQDVVEPVGLCSVPATIAEFANVPWEGGGGRRFSLDGRRWVRENR